MVILTPILMIFDGYKNAMNEFNLQFKIFTLVDKSYFILNGCITLTLKCMLDLSI